MNKLFSKLFKQAKPIPSQEKNNIESCITSSVDVLEKYPTEIEQIHHEFEIAGELILQEAIRIIQSTKIDNLLKVDRLKKLGFTSAEEVKMATEKIKQVEVSQSLAEKIQYYQFKYPLLKFITLEQLQNICSKYNLAYGEVSLYKGFVPDKNLKIIEEVYSKIDEKDCQEKIGSISTHGSNKGQVEWDGGNSASRYKNIYKEFKTIHPLIIAAPKNDFNMEGMEVKNYAITKRIPDPVVMQPVIGGYLILTAWGDEASDENVVNQKLN